MDRQPASISMPGVSIGGFVTGFQHEARRILSETEGSMSQVVDRLLREMAARGTISADSSENLSDYFKSTISTIAEERVTPEAYRASLERCGQFISDEGAEPVVGMLAELYHSAMVDAYFRSATNQDVGAAAAISGKGPQAVFWGTLGAFVGYGIGGPPGAVVGGLAGAALGACGDSDTTVTPT